MIGYVSTAPANDQRPTTNMRPKPLVLIILDGWGYSAKTEANAIALARKSPTTFTSELIRPISYKSLGSIQRHRAVKAFG